MVHKKIRSNFKIDVKRLIMEIYERPALWNQRNILYHNRDVTNQIWTEISAILETPKAILKSKWKGLRDTFRVEVKKEQVNSKTKDSDSKSTWAHFKRLEFLKEQMLPRPPVWERDNFICEIDSPSKQIEKISPTKSKRQPPVKSSCFRVEKNSEKRSIHFNTKETRKKASPAFSQSDLKNKRKKLSKLKTSLSSSLSPPVDCNKPTELHDSFPASPNECETPAVINGVNNISDEHETIIVKYEPFEDVSKNDEDESSVLLEPSVENGIMLQAVSSEQAVMTNPIGETCETQSTVNSVESSRFDDNHYFFMSLLPHIKALPAERCMRLRMQMQELVYKEVYKKNNSVETISS